MNRGMAMCALLLGALVLGCGGDGEAAEGPARSDDAPLVAAADPSDTVGGAGGASDTLDTQAGGEAGPAVGGSPEDVPGASGGADRPGGAPAPDTDEAGSPAQAPAAENAGGEPRTGAVEPSTAEGQDPSTAEILRETSRAYEGLRSFRAGFDQQIRNVLLGRTTRSSGTLYQRQPDRFLMDFSDPEGDLIVSDGSWFWMYFPSVDEKQVMRSPRGGQGLDLRAQFVGDPVRRFEATYHGTEDVQGRSAWVLTLDPREPAGYERMKVWIDTEDHLVRRFELTETSGNVRRVELSDFQANPALPDDLFEFTPPAGAQVVTRG